MENTSNKAYIIKYANGEGCFITYEAAQTEDGKKTLEFAKAANEETILLDTDDAVDMFLRMIKKEPMECNA